MKPYVIKYSEGFFDSLNNVITWVATGDVEAATDLYDAIMVAIEERSQQTIISSRVYIRTDKNKYYRLIVKKKYLVIYSIDRLTHQMIIHRVYYGRRNPRTIRRGL